MARRNGGGGDSSGRRGGRTPPRGLEFEGGGAATEALDEPDLDIAAAVGEPEIEPGPDTDAIVETLRRRPGRSGVRQESEPQVDNTQDASSASANTRTTQTLSDDEDIAAFGDRLKEAGASGIIAEIRRKALSRSQATELQLQFEKLSPAEQSRVYKELAGDLVQSAKEQRDELASQIRSALKPWDAMVVCADLAAVPEHTKEDQIALRMEALAREPFFWDKKLLAVDLSLYQRERTTEKGATDDRANEGRKKKTLKLQHCFAFRAPQDSNLSEEDYASLNIVYRQNLRNYMEEWGSSIDLDGHISRDPRYALKDLAEGPRPRDTDFKAHPFVSDVKPDFEVTIGGKALARPIPGSDDLFIRDVVEKSFGVSVERQPVVHFMEGIDKNFASLEDREGITAHMFLVYEYPGDVQQDCDFLRHLQLMLLRFCAYYMDHEAAKRAAEADAESKRANKVAEAAHRAREALRAQAQQVQKSIKELGALASDMEASMQDNPEVSKFILWIRDLAPLFETGKLFKHQYVPLEIVGNHNSWTADHLAAALWCYARFDPPKDLRRDLSMADLWNATWRDLTYEEIQSRIERMIVHRLKLDTMKRVRTDDLDRIFAVIKSWNNKYEELFKEGSGKTEFFLSQVVFLLGQPSFMKLRRPDGSTRSSNDPKFNFVSQTMLEGLMHFANNIDRGLNDDKLRSTLMAFEQEASISGGLEKVEIDVAGSARPSSDGQETAVERAIGQLGADHLVVTLTQHEMLSARSDNPNPGERQRAAQENFEALLAHVMVNKGPSPDDKEYETKRVDWQEKWKRGGQKETSRSLAKALGLSQVFALDNTPADQEQQPFLANASRPREEHWIRTYVTLPDSGDQVTLAVLRCKPDEHQYEFRFRARTEDLRFSDRR